MKTIGKNTPRVMRSRRAGLVPRVALAMMLVVAGAVTAGLSGASGASGAHATPIADTASVATPSCAANSALAFTTPATGDTVSPYISATGCAKAGAMVAVTATDADDNTTSIGTATAGDDGSWSMETSTKRLKHANYTLHASVGTTESASVSDITVSPGVAITSPTADSDVSNRPTITGTAVTPNTKVTVRAESEDTGETSYLGTTEAGDDGSWSFTPTNGLYKDASKLIANDGIDDSLPIYVTNTADCVITITSPVTGGAVQSSLTVSGYAEAGEEIVVGYMPDDMSETDITKSTPDGDTGGWSATLTLPTNNGGYWVYAAQNSIYSEDIVKVHVTAILDTVEITSPASDDEVSSRPTVEGVDVTPNASVEVRAVAGTTKRILGTAKAGIDGSWSLTSETSLTAGTYQLIANDGTDDSDPVTITVAAGSVVITSPAEDATVASLVKVTGYADPGAKINIGYEKDGSIYGPTGSGTADSDGSWSAEMRLAAGKYKIHAWVSGDDAGSSGASVSDVTVTSQGVTITSPTALAEVVGTVTVTGSTNPGATLEVHADDADGNGTSFGTVTAGDDGAWTITSEAPLSKGSYTVYAIDQDTSEQASVEITVVVAPGAVLKITPNLIHITQD